MNEQNINTEWLIALSNKLDNYFEQNNYIKQQINDIKNDLNNINLINIYNTKELINIKNMINQEIINNQVLKSNIDTINARLNDEILNLSYIDDKLQEMSNNIILLNEQHTEQVQSYNPSRNNVLI